MIKNDSKYNYGNIFKQIKKSKSHHGPDGLKSEKQLNKTILLTTDQLTNVNVQNSIPNTAQIQSLYMRLLTTSKDQKRVIKD